MWKQSQMDHHDRSSNKCEQMSGKQASLLQHNSAPPPAQQNQYHHHSVYPTGPCRLLFGTLAILVLFTLAANVNGKLLNSNTNNVNTNTNNNDYISLDRLNGAQFVELVDPLMEGQLSRIIDQIKRYNDLEHLPSANMLTARQYLRILDYLSANQVSSMLHSVFPSLVPLGPYIVDRPRRASLDTMSGLSLGYSKKSLDPMSGVSFGAPNKRSSNFDEIDRTGFSGFAKRANDFDEIDRAGFSGFAKRRSDFDEIDRAGFSGFMKRGRNFDEIDRAGFSSFAKRGNDFDEIDRAGFSGFAKRLNFDELDHSGFSGFVHKKSFNPLMALMRNHQQQQQTLTRSAVDRSLSSKATTEDSKTTDKANKPSNNSN